jgi:hypothetical protein
MWRTDAKVARSHSLVTYSDAPQVFEKPMTNFLTTPYSLYTGTQSFQREDEWVSRVLRRIC